MSQTCNQKCCECESCTNLGYCLSVSARGEAVTYTNDIVTSTSSASACSSVSYEDAWLNAYYLAKFNADIVAKNESNIIDQTLSIVEKTTQECIYARLQNNPATGLTELDITVTSPLQLSPTGNLYITDNNILAIDYLTINNLIENATANIYIYNYTPNKISIVNTNNDIQIVTTNDDVFLHSQKLFLYSEE